MKKFNKPARRDGADSRADQNADAKKIYGLNPVLEALRAEKRKIEKIVIAEGIREKRLSEVIALARKAGIPFQTVQRTGFSRFVENGVAHQGVIAFTASASYTDAEVIMDALTANQESGAIPLVVILDGVEDPRNLGAILRTVDCVGVDGVFIPERRAVGLTETVAKTSAGAVEHIKIAKVTNISNLIEDLKQRGIWVVGTSAEADTNYTDWDWNQPSALVLGSEGKGLHRLVSEKCDVLVKIPVIGKIESLNVSVAAGVVLYEALRQRTEGKGKK